jgi:hypothetical protein
MTSHELYCATVDAYNFLESLQYVKTAKNGATGFTSRSCEVLVSEARYENRPDISLVYGESPRFTTCPQEVFWYFVNDFKRVWEVAQQKYASAKPAESAQLVEILIERDLFKENIWLLTQPDKVTSSCFFVDIQKLNVWHRRQIEEGRFPDENLIIEQLARHKASHVG